MVLALSNALQLVITVFSSVPGHPLIDILPRTVAAPTPLFVAYNQYGSGHYGGIERKDDLEVVAPLPGKDEDHCTW